MVPPLRKRLWLSTQEVLDAVKASSDEDEPTDYDSDIYKPSSSGGESSACDADAHDSDKRIWSSALPPVAPLADVQNSTVPPPDATLIEVQHPTPCPPDSPLAESCTEAASLPTGSIPCLPTGTAPGCTSPSLLPLTYVPHSTQPPPATSLPERQHSTPPPTVTSLPEVQDSAPPPPVTSLLEVQDSAPPPPVTSLPELQHSTPPPPVTSIPEVQECQMRKKAQVKEKNRQQQEASFHLLRKDFGR
ncbi:hypothetical protein RRG08_022796 [Elysia crispata]|uniref:Uncharacterized protein n=1 Tax=Elysia crispata TaxID=231223 RepID=A0AAE0Z1S2_9GAST|nr:hypothetical protein RRG08_022796 [Elysia crispata]